MRYQPSQHAWFGSPLSFLRLYLYRIMKASLPHLFDWARRKDPEADPSMWSISYVQLMNFDDMCSKKFGNQYKGMTMRDINAAILEEICRAHGKSYALSLNPSGLMVEAFITHAWDEPFHEFVASIKSVFQSTLRKPNLWICAFALVQGDDDKIAEQLRVSNSASLSKSPFVKAIHKASSFVVVRNTTTDLYSRIWCVCELIYARKYGLVPEKTHVTGPDNFSHLHTSCLDANASVPRDKARILKTLLLEHDHDEIDSFIQELSHS